MSCINDHTALDCNFCPECGTPIVMNNNITVGNITFTNVPVVSSGTITMCSEMKPDSTNIKQIEDKINIEEVEKNCGEDTVKARELKYNDAFFEINENYFGKYDIEGSEYERQIVIKCLYSQNDVQNIKNMIIKKLAELYLLTNEINLEEFLKKALYKFIITVNVDEGRKYADELNKILKDIDVKDEFDIDDASWCIKLLNEIIIRKIQIPQKDEVLYHNNKFIALKYDKLNEIINNEVSVLYTSQYINSDLHIALYPDEDELNELKKRFEAVKDIKAVSDLVTKETVLKIRNTIIETLETLDSYDKPSDLLKSLKDMIDSIDINKF